MTDRNTTFFPEERRNPPDPQSALVLLIKQVNASVELLRDDIATQMTAHREELKTVVVSAFPEGDADGHRRHHEAVIKAAEDRAKFWQEMRIAAAKWAGLGAIAWLASVAWQAFLLGPKK